MRAYDFRIDKGGDPQPTAPGFFPGLWYLWSADRFFAGTPGIDHRMEALLAEHGLNPRATAVEKPPPEPPAMHRMVCCDVEAVAERFQRSAAEAFVESLRKFTQARCLIIGGAQPGHGLSKDWGYDRVREDLRTGGKMRALLKGQLPLYRDAGVFTYNCGLGQPWFEDEAIERCALVGSELLSEFGLERCLWCNGHYLDGEEWSPEFCERFLDMVEFHYDSVAVHHGPTEVNRLVSAIGRRLA